MFVGAVHTKTIPPVSFGVALLSVGADGGCAVTVPPCGGLPVKVPPAMIWIEPLLLLIVPLLVTTLEP